MNKTFPQKPLPPIKILYLVERTDVDCRQCWGANLGLVICADSEEQIEELIKTELMTSFGGDPAKTLDGKLLKREQISLKPLGVASTELELGIVMKKNAGH